MTHHANEDEMIAVYFEDADTKVLEHLETCPECQLHYRKLKAVLDATRKVEVPEVEVDYATSVWERIEPRLEVRTSDRSTRALPQLRHLGWLAAALILVVVSYTAGKRQTSPVSPTVEIVSVDPQAVLKVALTGHFERSRQLLREVSNIQTVASDSRLSERADRLLADNRLFRLAAQSESDPVLSMTLDDLERWLLDVAHLEPDTASLTDVQSRQRRRGLLLKLQILDNNLGRPIKGSLDTMTGENNGTSI